MFPPTPVRERAKPQAAAASAERIRAAAEERAVASYLTELLESPAWTEVLAPAIAQHRELYSEQLIAATLGFPVTVAAADADPLPPVVLAARCSALDWLQTFIESALRRGAAADARIARDFAELPSANPTSVV